MAVGGEDCNVCLVRVQPDSSSGGSCSDGSLRVTHSLQGHASSVRALSTSFSSSSSSKRLLFSGGARASLKVWSVGAEAWTKEDDFGVCLDAGLFLCDDAGRVRRKKKRGKFKPLGSEVLPECRVMALTSFPLSEVGCDLQTLHYVAAGCSDALIR